MVAPAGCPWWKKKRWWAVVLLWLVVAYPMATGPSQFAADRGLISYELNTAIFRPAFNALQATPLRDAHFEYWLLFTNFSQEEKDDLRQLVATRRNPPPAPPPPEPDRINRNHWTPPKAEP